MPTTRRIKTMRKVETAPRRPINAKDSAVLGAVLGARLGLDWLQVRMDSQPLWDSSEQESA